MKEFITKNYKWFITLIIVLVVLLIIAFLYLFNRNKTPDVIPQDPYQLSLVNIDDLNYDPINTYYSEFTLINNMCSYQVEAELVFSEDNVCEYSSSWYSEAGSYTFNSTKCNYEFGKNNSIEIVIDGTLQFYNNSIMDYQTEIISDYVLNGTFKYDNKSHLLLNGLTFEHFDYYTYYHCGINEVLVSYTDEIYKTDGSKFWAEEENLLDLSLYEIVDRRTNNNDALNYINEYDITDIVTDDSLVNVGCNNFVTESYLLSTNTVYLEIDNIRELRSVLTETPSYYFLYISYIGDSNVYNLEKELKPLIDEYQLQNNFYFLNVTDFKDSNVNYREDIAEILGIDASIISDIPVILYYSDGEFAPQGIYTSQELEDLLKN